jgi:hypothetical protein
MKFLSNVRLLLLVLWLGAAAFFSFAVAPSAFAVLPSRELAGAMVSRSLMIVNISGLVIGLILLTTAFFSSRGANLFFIWIERLLLLIVAAACAVGHFVIGLWLSFVRAEIGRPIDELAMDDPLRIKFNNLHEYSVWILVGAMIAALLAFFIISAKNWTPEKETKNLDFQNDFKI